MMGTHAELNAQENIACMQFMENEVLNVAKSKGFIGILTTNTSPLTQVMNELNHIIIDNRRKSIISFWEF